MSVHPSVCIENPVSLLPISFANHQFLHKKVYSSLILQIRIKKHFIVHDDGQWHQIHNYTHCS